MVSELMVVGGTSGVVAVFAFGGAVMETLKLEYAQMVREPVPSRLLQTLDQMGGDNAVNSENSASS